ncbi:MAG: hypothetical protein M3Y42_12040 [Actinomycetota bacterium]|nr:hypothetical protein [Actinomycetota bacterium]
MPLTVTGAVIGMLISDRPVVVPPTGWLLDRLAELCPPSSEIALPPMVTGAVTGAVSSPCPL